MQLSEDSKFETDPKKATKSVTWEFINGCVTDPINSYQVNKDQPLKSKSSYYWRVRPRIQGDGLPVPWSQTWQFKTP